VGNTAGVKAQRITAAVSFVEPNPCPPAEVFNRSFFLLFVLDEYIALFLDEL
jgi:hypothetical protein